MQYGISYLPSGNIPYNEGYRYGAYTISDNGDITVNDFFKMKDEVQTYVNKNPKYGRTE